MRYLLIVLVVLGGAIVPVQVAANKRMEQAVGSPVVASALALFVGSLVLALVAATGWLGPGNLMAAGKAPWWVWLASALSLFTVISIVALPRVGAAAVIAAMVFGQLTAAALLDHFGWLGVPQIRLSWLRVCGAIALLVGTLMLQYKSGGQDNPEGRASRAPAGDIDRTAHAMPE